MSSTTCACGRELSNGAILSGDTQCSVCWHAAHIGQARATATKPSAEAQAAVVDDRAAEDAAVARLIALGNGAPLPTSKADHAEDDEEAAYLRRMKGHDDEQTRARRASRAVAP